VHRELSDPVTVGTIVFFLFFCANACRRPLRMPLQLQCETEAKQMQIQCGPQMAGEPPHVRKLIGGWFDCHGKFAPRRGRKK